MLTSDRYFPELQWSVDSAVFTDDFKVLALGSYDGILGWDWLAKHSPMLTDWKQGWLAVKHQGKTVVLQGADNNSGVHGVLLLQLMQESKVSEPEEKLPEVKGLLAKFSAVFATPTGLPPRR